MCGSMFEGKAVAVGSALSPPHRDMRFPMGKSPYRTHVALRLRHRFALPGGPGPTFLMWLSLQARFPAAGVHQYNGESLRRLREAMLRRPDVWGCVRTLAELDGHDMALRTPNGFPKNHEWSEDLLRRRLTITRPLSQKRIIDPNFATDLVSMSKTMLPFAEFRVDALYGQLAST
jgi:uncharacterized protein (DUF2461 family)